MLKKDARLLFKSKREKLSPSDISKESLQITTQLFKLLDQLQYQTVNCFLTNVDKKEVQTSSIFKQLWDKRKNTSVPVSNYSDYSMTCVSYSKDTVLEMDQYQIPFPVNHTKENPLSIDVILCPLLAFDNNGFRVGYGKGMYDRFLEKCNKEVVTIGLSFFDPIPTINDVNSLDKKMNYVLTPKGIHSF